MSNGRIRGVDNTTSLSNASGMYDNNEIRDARVINSWPFAIPEGCIMYLDAGLTESYSGTGTTWYDLSGQGNHCEAQSNPTHTSGSAGSFALDGNDWFEPPDLTATTFQNGLTIFSVANFGTANSNESLLGLSSAGSNDNSSTRLYRNSSSTDLRLVCKNSSASTIVSIKASSTSIVNSTVQSFAATLDGANANLYADGVNCGTAAETSTPATSQTLDEGGIGYHNSGTDRYFTGDIAVMMLFNRGLSATEITSLHNLFATRYSL